MASTSAANEPETRAPRSVTVNASLPAAISSSAPASGETNVATATPVTSRSATAAMSRVRVNADLVTARTSET